MTKALVKYQGMRHCHRGRKRTSDCETEVQASPTLRFSIHYWAGENAPAWWDLTGLTICLTQYAQEYN